MSVIQQLVQHSTGESRAPPRGRRARFSLGTQSTCGMSNAALRSQGAGFPPAAGPLRRRCRLLARATC